MRIVESNMGTTNPMQCDMRIVKTEMRFFSQISSHFGFTYSHLERETAYILLIVCVCVFNGIFGGGDVSRRNILHGWSVVAVAVRVCRRRQL